MAKTRAIQVRMKAVANIRRITKTMQMIATARFAAAQQRALAAKPYAEGVFALVRELGASAADAQHPLLLSPRGEHAGKPELFLVITSDRGLCGPYNSAVLRTAMGAIRASAGARPELELVGKKGASFLKFQGEPIARQHAFGDNPRREEVERLAEEYMARFTSGEVSGVRIVFTRYLSAGRQEAEAMQLLPLKPPATTGAGDKKEAAGPRPLYEFSPPAEELLAVLLPETVKTTLWQCFSDALVSEHVARMIAMKAATDAAGKMSQELTRRYKRARQAQITTELTEIISGAAALE